jgi:hypothetical protein
MVFCKTGKSWICFYVIALFILVLLTSYSHIVKAAAIDYNGSFEVDSNNNNLPDFWETNWRNGSSTGPYAQRLQDRSIDGGYIYQLRRYILWLKV